MSNEVLNAANGTTPVKIAIQKGSGGAGFVSGRAPSENFASGTLPGTAAVVQDMTGHPIPCTLVLNTGAASPVIQISVNGGTTYFTPTPDASSTSTMKIVTIGAPITHASFAGQANDTYSIR